MISNEHQECIDSLLQREIQITHNSKVLRKGILILYTVKDYYITFILKTPKKINKVYEIPRPFNIISDDDNNVILDYRLLTLCNDNKEKADVLAQLAEDQPINHKFLDTIVNMTIQ